MSPRDKNQSAPISSGRRTFIALSAAHVAASAVLNSGEDVKAEHQSEPVSFKSRLLECLGGEWPSPCPLSVEHRETIRKDGYRIESITYEVEPKDRVPAMVLVPDGVDAAHPAAAVAVWHQHAGEWHFGKSEPAGLAGNPMHHTGVSLVKEGYVVLCPDALCFEERQSPDLKKGDYERYEFLRLTVAGTCMAWKNILDMRRAIDYLSSRSDVIKNRLGCYGHSMGSTHTWLVGPWDERLICLVGNCCLPTYAAIHRTHMLHCFPNFIPGIFQYGDTPDIAALIAPRALLLNFGELDSGSPIEEVRSGVETIAKAYAKAGAAEKFNYCIEPGVAHVLSESMWIRTRDWFSRHLKV